MRNRLFSVHAITFRQYLLELLPASIYDGVSIDCLLYYYQTFFCSKSIVLFLCIDASYVFLQTIYRITTTFGKDFSQHLCLILAAEYVQIELRVITYKQFMHYTSTFIVTYQKGPRNRNFKNSICITKTFQNK